MAYFHVRLSVAGERSDEVSLDLQEDQLDQRFIDPYLQGSFVTLNGRTIAVRDIARIRISRSEQTGSSLKAEVEARQRRSNVVSTAGPSKAWRAAALAEDVTDDYITSAPGGEQRVDRSETGQGVSSGEKNTTVFVVHGRDLAARDSMFAFLTSVGLKPMEWSQAVALTGEGSPYTGRVLDVALDAAQAVVVLFTPDEYVLLRPELAASEADAATALQARPNVIFEAGMALAKSEQRTIFVEVGAHRTFSDIGGRHQIRLEGTPQKRNDLLQRLRTAGCAVDTSGNLWLTAGDFKPPVVTGAPSLSFSSQQAEPKEGARSGPAAIANASSPPKAAAVAEGDGLTVTLQDADAAGGGTYRVRGRAYNSNRNAKSANFTATFFDENGSIVGTATGGVLQLGQEQTKTVELLSFDNLDFYANMEVQIDGVF